MARRTQEDDLYDVAIIGGGPAGLSAALWLGRYLHSVIVIDSGDPRNWETRGINGFLGSHGIRSPELRQCGRDNAKKFGVEFIDSTVETARNENSERFTLALGDGTEIRSRRILIATGIKDVWPRIDGLGECYGETVHVCPDCDGYEGRDSKTVVIGSGRKAVGMALALTTWTHQIVICTNGAPPDIQQGHLDKLKALNIPVIEEKVDRVISEDGEIRGVNLESGMQLDCEQLYFAIGQRPADEQAASKNLEEQLNCDLDESGMIITDERHRTSVTNVFAAGDIVPGSQLAIVAASEGAIAALAIHASLVPDTRKLE